MKKFFSFALMTCALVAGFASCSNDDETMGSRVAQTSVGFSVNAEGGKATRGLATTSSKIIFTDFQTWAYDDVTNGIYMGAADTGKTVTLDGGAWKYAPTQFWPVNALNFVAIAPAAPNGVSANATSSEANVVTLNTTLTLSTNVEDQDDIMYANADGITKDTNGGNVPYLFQHALSQVVFKGKFDGKGAVTRATIAEIALGGINSTATLVYTSEGKFYGETKYPAVSATPAVFSLDADDLEGADWKAAEKGTDAFDLTVSNNADKKNAWFMIPQTTTAWDGNSVNGKVPASGAYIKLRVKLEKDGVVIKNNTEDDAIYLPLSVDWELGKKYIYTIEFNGENALDPITFSVTAADWTDSTVTPNVEF